MRKIFLFAVLFTRLAASASPTVVLSGKIVGYDEKTITLQQTSGALVKVPKAAIPDIKKVKIGKDEVEVQVNPTDFLRLNPDLTKK